MAAALAKDRMMFLLGIFSYNGKNEHETAAVAAREAKPYGDGFASACSIDPLSPRREREHWPTSRNRLLSQSPTSQML